MIKVQIVDATGSSRGLKINGEGEMPVVVHPHPPLDEEILSIPFRQFFSLNGDGTGTTDMRVNGATTNQTFYIEAIANYDLYIALVYVVLADAGASLDKFGNLTALTNGVQFNWITNDIGTETLFDGFKQNLDFFKLTKSEPQIIDLSGAGADAIIVPIDLVEIFKNTYGLRLRKNTKDRLEMIVRDDLSTGLDEFNIVGMGIKI